MVPPAKSDRAAARRTTSDEVADALREAIARGDFADGAELNQVALARDFGVSRVPVREALRQLQAEGLISAQAHMRAVVKGLTLERILEVLDLRTAVESYLVGRAAQAPLPDLNAVRGICAVMEEVDDHQQWLVLNRQFHEKLYEHTGAELAQDLARQLLARVERYLRLVSEHGVDRMAEANAEHRAILNAVARGDVAAARHALEQHIRHTGEGVRRLFAERARADAPGAAATGAPSAASSA
jgi:DNA-binding GntR family transcriptional regulator